MSLDIRTGESSWGPPPHELSPYNVTFGRQRLGSWSLSAPASTDMSVESLRLAVYQSSVRGCFSGNARQIPQQKFSFPFFKRGRGSGAEPLVPLVNRSINQNLNYGKRRKFRLFELASARSSRYDEQQSKKLCEGHGKSCHVSHCRGGKHLFCASQILSVKQTAVVDGGNGTTARVELGGQGHKLK